jgi:glycosyltransferase involved in cell wall biosynthesis
VQPEKRDRHRASSRVLAFCKAGWFASGLFSVRVLIINHYADRRGGADAYTEALSLGLADAGHEVIVACFDASPDVRKHCRVMIVAMPDFTSRAALWRVSRALGPLAWTRALRAVGETVQPDVIINSVFSASGACQRFWPKTPQVYVPHARDVPTEVWDTDKKLPLDARLVGASAAFIQEWGCIRRSAFVVRFTQSSVEHYKRMYWTPKRVRFAMLPSTIRDPPLASRPERVSAPVKMVAIGRLVPSKNLAFLFGALARTETTDWHLTVAGDGPERPQLEALACRLGIYQRVEFLGHRDDIQHLLATFDLHVFPSVLESYGLVVLESMAAGVPTLGFRPDGARFRNINDELIENDVDGLLANDEADFERKLAALLADPRELRSLGAHARRRYLTNHSWTAFVQRWCEVLDSARATGTST